MGCVVNLNARLYDPVIGKFLAPDSIVPDLFNGQSLNRYAYVMNNPSTMTDTTGHDGDDPETVTVTGTRGADGSWYGGFSFGGVAVYFSDGPSANVAVGAHSIILIPPNYAGNPSGTRVRVNLPFGSRISFAQARQILARING